MKWFGSWSKLGQISRARHAKILSRQCDHVVRAQSCLYLSFTIFVVASPSRHWGLTIFQNFSGPWLFLEALLRCRIVVVAKLKNCRMPSSANFVIRIQIDHMIYFILKSNIYNYIMIGEPGHSASGQLGHRSSERHFQPGKSRGL